MRRLLLSATALLILAACGSDDGSASEPATTTAAPTTVATPTTVTTPTTVPATTLHLQWTSAGSRHVIGTPTCDATQNCLFPSSGTATWSGDIEGPLITSGTAAAVAGSANFALSRTDLFAGTVKGCGTGTFVYRAFEDGTPTSGVGEGEVVEGFGTGDLATLTGTFSGSGTVDDQGTHATLEGDFDCG